MPKTTRFILGIESSCDDSSVALVNTDTKELLDCLTKSSSEIQSHYGGVVPEIAAREHEQILLNLVQDIMKLHEVSWDQISHIAYTNHPGLTNCLFVAIVLAKTLSYIFKIPTIPINHVYGHIFSIGLTEKMIFPHLSLVISGKTTALYWVKGPLNIELLDSTKDNAIGESYDKVARAMSLPYPGGQHIDDLYDPALEVPRLLKNELNPAKPFSYSGIMSAANRLWADIQNNDDIINKKTYLATIFQRCVIDSLVKKINYWIGMKFKYNKKKYLSMLTISGGVASNNYLKNSCQNINAKVLFSDKRFSQDNAAMIAYYSSWII